MKEMNFINPTNGLMTKQEVYDLLIKEIKLKRKKY